MEISFNSLSDSHIYMLPCRGLVRDKAFNSLSDSHALYDGEPVDTLFTFQFSIRFSLVGCPRGCLCLVGIPFNSLSDSHGTPTTRGAWTGLIFQFSIRFSHSRRQRHRRGSSKPLSILYQILTDGSPGPKGGGREGYFNSLSDSHLTLVNGTYVEDNGLSILYQILTLSHACATPSEPRFLSILYQILTGAEDHAHRRPELGFQFSIRFSH